MNDWLLLMIYWIKIAFFSCFTEHNRRPTATSKTAFSWYSWCKSVIESLTQLDAQNKWSFCGARRTKEWLNVAQVCIGQQVFIVSETLLMCHVSLDVHSSCRHTSLPVYPVCRLSALTTVFFFSLSPSTAIIDRLLHTKWPTCELVCEQVCS